MRRSPALLPGAVFAEESLLAPDVARERYFAAVAVVPAGIETVPLAEAFGRILAAPAVADAPIPSDARSTMDGFALRSADGTATRRITGDIRMGHAPPGPVGPGEAMRIPTGGVLPAGADAVVPIEDADVVTMAGEVGEAISVRESPEPQAFVTARGSDMAPGDAPIGPGRRIGGPELSVLATLGIVAVPVFRRPRIAIVSTGDELVDAARTPARGQIRDSNRWAIAGTLAALGAEPVQLPNAADDLAAIRAQVAAGLAAADAVILTGGSSVGERDLTPDVIESFDGPGVIVHGLAVKPGKPTVLAAVGTKPVIGLPGNPTSALTILDAVCAPIIHALTGERDARPETIAVLAGAPFTGRPGWTWYVPAELRRDPSGGERAFPLALRSSQTSLLARAHGYVVVGPAHAQIDAGERVDVVRFRGGGRA
jgi:molybdenum cofactor synthesis domain-containing protein